MFALGIMVVTYPEGVLCFFMDLTSSSGIGDGPNVLKMMVWGAVVDLESIKLPKEMTLWLLAGCLLARAFCFSRCIS